MANQKTLSEKEAEIKKLQAKLQEQVKVLNLILMTH
jgi:hypothetical protein